MAEQSLVDIAKAPIIAYNDKNWDAVKAAVVPRFVYDEVGSQRKPDAPARPSRETSREQKR